MKNTNKKEIRFRILAVLVFSLEQGHKEINIFEVLGTIYSYHELMPAIRYLLSKELIEYDEQASLPGSILCKISKKGILAFEEKQKRKNWNNRIKKTADFLKNTKVISSSILALAIAFFSFFTGENMDSMTASVSEDKKNPPIIIQANSNKTDQNIWPINTHLSDDFRIQALYSWQSTLIVHQQASLLSEIFFRHYYPMRIFSEKLGSTLSLPFLAK